MSKHEEHYGDFYCDGTITYTYRFGASRICNTCGEDVTE